MFTGLVEEVGKIIEVRPSRGAKLFRIQAEKVMQGISVDDSIAVSGVCLTVIAHTASDFSVEAVEETLKKTTLDGKRPGDAVNLERALAVGGWAPQAGGKLLSIRLPESLLPYVIPKGSIAIDGVSLTVAELQPPLIKIALIPHTLEVTTLGSLQKGDRVNVEVDMVGKYIVNLVQPYLDRKPGEDRFGQFQVKVED